MPKFPKDEKCKLCNTYDGIKCTNTICFVYMEERDVDDWCLLYVPALPGGVDEIR